MAWPQYPFYYGYPPQVGTPRYGWICSRCNASNSPDTQQCFACMPPVTCFLQGGQANPAPNAAEPMVPNGIVGEIKIGGSPEVSSSAAGHIAGEKE